MAQVTAVEIDLACLHHDKRNLGQLIADKGISLPAFGRLDRRRVDFSQPNPLLLFNQKSEIEPKQKSIPIDDPQHCSLVHKAGFLRPPEPVCFLPVFHGKVRIPPDRLDELIPVPTLLQGLLFVKAPRVVIGSPWPKTLALNLYPM